MAPLANFSDDMHDIFAEISSRQNIHSQFLSHIVHSEDEIHYQDKSNIEDSKTNEDQEFFSC